MKRRTLAELTESELYYRDQAGKHILALNSLAAGDVIWIGRRPNRIGYCRLMGASGGLVLIETGSPATIDVYYLDSLAEHLRILWDSKDPEIIYQRKSIEEILVVRGRMYAAERSVA